MFKSIRRQLSLSYAAIALLTALALGAILVSSLLSYYAQRELVSLASNANAIGAFLAESDAWDLSQPERQALAQSLSFLVQARVQILGKDGQVLADTGPSGDAQYLAVSAVPVPEAASDVLTRTTGRSRSIVVLRTVGGSTRALPSPGSDNGAFPLHNSQALTGTTSVRSLMLYGSLLAGEAAPDGARSNHAVRQPVYDGAGNVLGYVQLSNGPAYGTQIVESVARGWALASAVAVLLATAAGWLASRRISAPVRALAGATGRMAGGDLAARAATGRKAPRELASLAHSFNQMAGQVEETVLALRRFVSDAAHELHTPLTALRTDLELAAGEDDVADVRPLLERAQSQVLRLAGLTDGLLELSRIEAGAPNEEALPIDMATVVREMAELEASRAEQAGLAFSVTLPDGEVTVEGRENRLRGVVANLVDNALKFTPTGGSVTVDLRREEAWAVLSVADTGIGIPEEDLPQLFNRFHRGRNTTGCPGNGLGLAIVKAVAESHGGSVCAENCHPGARFVVRLPLSGRAGGS